MSIFILVLNLLIFLLAGIVLGRYTRGWGGIGLRKILGRDVKEKVGFCEKISIISPSRRSGINRVVEDITKGNSEL